MNVSAHDSFDAVRGYIRENLFTDERQIREIIDLYFSMTQARLLEVEALLLAKNWSELARLGHMIRGGSAHIGADVLSWLGHQLEEGAEVHDADRCRENICEIRKHLDKLLSESGNEV